MVPSQPKPALRPFLPSDGPILADIVQASIMELTGEDYSESQQEAWAETALDPGFAQRLAGGLTLIATMDGTPVGFVCLQKNERIDMLYVHPEAAGQGVGTLLCDAVEKLAAARGAARLTADVSDNARSFFEGRGFTAQRRNTLPLGDEWLGTTTMDKRLAEPEAGKLSS